MGDEIWITAAFKSASESEAYIFMDKECALYNYQRPVQTGVDKIVTGPTPTVEQFPFLKSTIFEDLGIYCAFPSHTPGKAFIFTGDQAAEIDYANGKMVQDPVRITTMFPFLIGSSVPDFENGIEAAFESSVPTEVYMLSGKYVGYFNIGTNPGTISIRTIVEQWPGLKGTIFENGADAAYNLYEGSNEAFIFKGDTYARVRFTPRKQTDEPVLFGPAKIKDGRKALGAILPRIMPDMAFNNASL